MLDKLFGSKTRAQLLSLFFLHTDKAFYIRELARKFKSHTNSIRRELNNLVDIGVLVELDEVSPEQIDSAEEASQQKKYYQVNKNFILYSQLKELFSKAQLLIQDKIGKRLEGVGKINLLLLTGGFTGASHVATDIFIVGQIKKDKLKKVISKFETEIGKEIYYTVMSKREFDERRSLTDCFVFDVLTSNKLILIDDFNIDKDER